MSSEVVIRDLFRSLETVLHERLAMIEDVVQLSLTKRLTESRQDMVEAPESVDTSLIDMVQSIEMRLANMEIAIQRMKPVETVHVHKGTETPVSQENLWTLHPMKGLEIHLTEDTGKPKQVVRVDKELCRPVETLVEEVVEDVVEDVEEEEEEVEEEVEEE